MPTLPLGLTLKAACRRAAIGAALALAAFALVTDVAAGATARVESDDGKKSLVFTAAASERNSVSVSVSGSQYTIVDTGATVSPGTGCTLLSVGRVRCSTSSQNKIRYVHVATGDGDDTVTVTGAIPSVIDGGSGADTLRGGDAADWLWGNTGDDLLDGGAGGDFISGWDGRDRVDYSTRTAGVTVSLNSSSGDGQAGEGDNVYSSVEDVTGGHGNDVLTGSAGANALFGGSGDDSLNGGDGDDALDGGTGRDALDGGAGNDGLSSRDGEGDDDRCGIGYDSVTGDYLDVLADDCEVRDLTAAPAAPALLDRVPTAVRLTFAGRIRVRVSCPAGSGGCQGVLSAAIMKSREGRRRIRAARALRSGNGTRFALRAGESDVFKVKISRNGRRRVIRDKKANCRISAVTRSSGRSATATKTVVVKAPKKRGGRR
jgi:Ca2+-binding RTX toxin-like protein